MVAPARSLLSYTRILYISLSYSLLYWVICSFKNPSIRLGDISEVGVTFQDYEEISSSISVKISSLAVRVQTKESRFVLNIS